MVLNIMACLGDLPYMPLTILILSVPPSITNKYKNKLLTYNSFPVNHNGWFKLADFCAQRMDNENWVESFLCLTEDINKKKHFHRLLCTKISFIFEFSLVNLCECSAWISFVSRTALWWNCVILDWIGVFP